MAREALRSIRWPAAAVATALLLAPAGAGAASPDTAGRTPADVRAAAAATSPVSAPGVRRGLARMLRCRRCGAFVADLDGRRALFGRAARKRRALASNMKLFATGAALGRLGPEGALHTQAWRIGGLNSDGVLRGNIVLRGGGDPTLGRAALAQLATRVRAAGVRRVTGRLIFDASFFDRRRSVPTTGVSGNHLGGSLSGLHCSCGGPRAAARVFATALRARGIPVGGARPGRLRAGRPGRGLIAAVPSPGMAALAKATNEFSSNFFAEMLVKALGRRVRGRGSTRAGIRVIQGFSRRRGARIVGENGSGLSVRDRSTPRAVVNFLRRMHLDAGLRPSFAASLPVAGRSGTLRNRMRGTAAAGRCRAKTGTLAAVSTLSGYCTVDGGRTVAFSILMNRVSPSAARSVQDRMTALIARYRP